VARRLRPIGHEDRLSIVDHLDELRTRLIWCLGVLILCFSVTYWQHNRLLDIVNKPFYASQHASSTASSSNPLEQASARYRSETKVYKALSPWLAGEQDALRRAASRAGVPPADRAALEAQARRAAALQRVVDQAAKLPEPDTKRRPVTLGVTEPFVTTFTVAGYAALLLALPFILYQLYAFILPAFSPQERRTALPLMLMVPLLFVAGVAFGYFLALPRAVDFLQNFNQSSFDVLLQAKDYYRFSVVLLAVIGLLFQIPVGVLAITRLGVVSARRLSRSRGYVILAIAVVAAIATPTPDPVTMLVAMAPLIVLWELSVLFARIVEKRAERDEASHEDLWDPVDGVEDRPTLS
jgi:sec-independent protein translocase protein TatC